ncbi:MAG: hypothetical protein AABZ60_11925 [Planctomycetota bacterium]
MNSKLKTKIVLLPGLDGTGKLFEPFLKTCPEILDPVVISFPTQKFLPYSELENWVLERIPKPDPFLLLAESFSGPLAIRLTQRLGSELLGLVLCNTFIQPHALLYFVFFPGPLYSDFRLHSGP